MYPLSEAANPKPTRFVDGLNTPLHTLPFYDIRALQDIHDIISVEPVRPRDKVMMGMLATSDEGQGALRLAAALWSGRGILEQDIQDAGCGANELNRRDGLCRKISKDAYQFRRLTVLAATAPPPGDPTISYAVEEDRETLVPFATRCVKIGHDEFLLNPLKTAFV